MHLELVRQVLPGKTNSPYLSADGEHLDLLRDIGQNLSGILVNGVANLASHKLIAMRSAA
jgi:hypothetical protein